MDTVIVSFYQLFVGKCYYLPGGFSFGSKPLFPSVPLADGDRLRFHRIVDDPADFAGEIHRHAGSDAVLQIRIGHDHG